MKRGDIIDQVVSDLVGIRSGLSSDKRYALEENIKFFNAVRSLPGYMRWLYREMPKIDPDRLLELSDFGIGKWEAVLQSELLVLEKNRFIDMLGKIRQRMLSEIENMYKDGGRPLTVMNIGAGNLEIERQVIESLKGSNFPGKVMFLAIDSSLNSLSVGLDNISSTDVKKIKINDLPGDLERVLSSASSDRFILCYYIGDAVDAGNKLRKGSIDLVYYSKLRHHIPRSIRGRFDSITTFISDKVIEWDDYRGLYLPFFSSLTAWNKPILLNGAVFSYLRDPSKRELSEDKRPGWETKIFAGSGYLRDYDARRL